MPRFVILFHEMPLEDDRPSHWDLMLESDTALSTWALAQEPRSDITIQAEELADHRKAYLEYEGPVSNHRGTVSRWDFGSFQYTSRSENDLRFTLQGLKTCGTAILSRQESLSRQWELKISETRQQ